MVTLFREGNGLLQQYHQYAQTLAALSEEYHKLRLADTYRGVPIEELTLAASLDARETPASLDRALGELPQAKRVIYDRVQAKFHVFI